MLYDKLAIYFGVRCYEDNPQYISDNLIRRDEIENSDFVGIYINSYDDNITAYNCMITASGVLVERYVYNDGSMDSGWDAIWGTRVSRTEDGWYAEYRIPYACLRIRHSDDMTWGLNVFRYMHSPRRRHRLDSLGQADAWLCQSARSPLKYSKKHRFSSFQRKPESSNTLNNKVFFRSLHSLG